MNENNNDNNAILKWTWQLFEEAFCINNATHEGCMDY